MYDIAQQSFREGNSEGRHEAANFDSDNEEEFHWLSKRWLVFTTKGKKTKKL